MQPAARPPRLATLMALTVTSVLTLTMVVPSLGAIARDLGSDYRVISLALGAYLAVTAVVQLCLGSLGDRIGRRPVVLGGLALFVLASIGCALAWDAASFLAFRILQASVVSGQVMSQAIVRDTTSGITTVRRLGYIAMAVAMAPMLGPLVGSLLDEAFGWRAGFMAFAILGTGLWCLAWADLGETRHPAPPDSTAKPERMADLLREPRFWAWALCTATSIGGFYTFLGGAPLIAEQLFDLHTTALGVAMGAMTLGFLAGTIVDRLLSGRTPHSNVVVAGRTLAVLSSAAGLALAAVGQMTPAAFFACAIGFGLGNGLTTPGSNAGALSVRPRLAGTAAGVLGAMIVGGGALMTTVSAYAVSLWLNPGVLMAILLVLSLAGLGAVLTARTLEGRIR